MGLGPVPAWWYRVWVALAILVAYSIPLLIVPPTPPTPLVDDWAYQLAVKHLLDDHRLWIAPATVVSLLLQEVWGALFALPFGVTQVALRSSTLVAGCGGTLACYGLFRELGATRRRALIGALAVWFTPVAFVLSHTFMSDVPFLALLSAGAYAAVVATRRRSMTGLAVASALAGMAFLVRQQGALIPLSMLGWLLLVRPPWFRAAPWRAMAAALGPCLVAVVGYYRWMATHQLPAEQQLFIRVARETGVQKTLDVVWQVGMVGLFEVGLFVLPLVCGALRELPAAWRRAGNGTRALVVVGLVVTGFWANAYALAHNGHSFPFIPWGSAIHEDGLGTLDDVYGRRPSLFAPWQWAVLGALVALSAASAFLLLFSRQTTPPTGAAADPAAARLGLLASPAGLVIALGIGQFGGIIPPALPISSLIAYDRYYLPLLPFAVGLVLWALRDRRFSPALALAALALLAVVDTLGVQDWFAFKQAYWDTAAWLVEDRRVPLRHVDGGLGWDAMHFYEETLAHPDERATRRPGDPWWIAQVAPMISSDYMVSATPKPIPGYVSYARRPYHSWIRSDDETWIYVWKRQAARPPSPAASPRRGGDHERDA